MAAPVLQHGCNSTPTCPRPLQIPCRRSTNSLASPSSLSWRYSPRKCIKTISRYSMGDLSRLRRMEHYAVEKNNPPPKLEWRDSWVHESVKTFYTLLLGSVFLFHSIRHGGLVEAWLSSPTYVAVQYSELLERIEHNQISYLRVEGNIMFAFELKPGVVQPPPSKISRLLHVTDKPLDRVLSRYYGPRKTQYFCFRDWQVRAPPYNKIDKKDLEMKTQYIHPFFRHFGIYLMLYILYLFTVLFLRLCCPMTYKKFLRMRGYRCVSTNVTFADIVGAENAKQELREIVEFLQNPIRHTQLGAMPTKGVLLDGLPGTTKTFLAKAVAGEAKIPFISFSAVMFDLPYGKSAASKVENYFQQAIVDAPSVIFIDKIDAVAKSQDSDINPLEMSNWEQILDKIKMEMDGLKNNSKVIVLGATNEANLLDPSLLQPGRFDRVVKLDVPDRTSREAILKMHISERDFPFSLNVDLKALAAMTMNYNGGDLVKLINDAVLLAQRTNKQMVSKEEFIQAGDQSTIGEQRMVRVTFTMPMEALLNAVDQESIADREETESSVNRELETTVVQEPRVENMPTVAESPQQPEILSAWQHELRDSGQEMREPKRAGLEEHIDHPLQKGSQVASKEETPFKKGWGRAQRGRAQRKKGESSFSCATILTSMTAARKALAQESSPGLRRSGRVATKKLSPPITVKDDNNEEDFDEPVMGQFIMAHSQRVEELEAGRIIEEIRALKEDVAATRVSMDQLVANIGAFIERQNH